MKVLQFLLAGGLPMLFVLVLGVLAIVAAAGHARRPSPHRLAVVRALTIATTFSVLCGTFAAFCAVFTKIPAHPEWVVRTGFANLVMTGVAEALTAGVVGFALLSVTWMLVAVGARRSEG